MKRRIVIVTNLYPNSNEPVRGLYISQLVGYLRSSYEIRVVAPVPWLPGWVARKWRPALALPCEEVIDGVPVYHPRYLVIPKVFRFSHGLAFAASVGKLLRSLRRKYDFELISAHWLYPDVFGTVLAARSLGVPVVAHALGCDVNDYFRFPLRRRMIKWALSRADAVVAKSGELACKIRQLGLEPRKIETIYNGIDRQRFRRRCQTEQRSVLGLSPDKKIILFIGNFSVEKGITYLLQALAQLRQTRDDVLLCLVGSGPLQADIEREVSRLGIQGCTLLPGRVAHERIPLYLSAADVLCLPSLREGCPNVVLEALASGTPVVASSVGAVPEMMDRTKIGLTTNPGDVSALSAKLLQAISLPKDVERSFDWISWEENAEAVARVFARSMVRE